MAMPEINMNYAFVRLDDSAFQIPKVLPHCFGFPMFEKKQFMKL